MWGDKKKQAMGLRQNDFLFQSSVLCCSPTTADDTHPDASTQRTSCGHTRTHARESLCPLPNQTTMHAKTLQVVWHAKEPVFSVDFHPDGTLATGGGDKDVKVSWRQERVWVRGRRNDKTRARDLRVSHQNRPARRAPPHATLSCAPPRTEAERNLFLPSQRKPKPCGVPISSSPHLAPHPPSPPQLWRLATAPDGSPAVEHVADLTSHTRSVNAVRFSPDGSTLASAGDGGEVLLWRRASTTAPWKAVATVRAHADDVFDVAWSPDATALATAALDGSASLMAVDSDGRARRVASLDGHRHYVQGVAWDPSGTLVATAAADRSVRVWGGKPGKKRGWRRGRGGGSPALRHRGRWWPGLRGHAGPPDGTSRHAAAAASGGGGWRRCSRRRHRPPHPPPAPRVHLFADETLPTFFRRLAFSPDGSCLAVPAALLAPGGGRGAPPAHGAFVYARGAWDAPALALPSVRPVVAVRFCPVLFALDPPPRASPPVGAGAPPPTPGGEGASPGGAAPPPPLTDTAPSVFALPYRLVYAVASLDSLALYASDAPGGAPLALLGGLHPEPITDVAWSCDGRSLAVASYDGYVSVATFGEGELGVVATGLPPRVAERAAAAAKGVAPPATPARAARRRRRRRHRLCRRPPLPPRAAPAASPPCLSPRLPRRGAAPAASRPRRSPRRRRVRPPQPRRWLPRPPLPLKPPLAVVAAPAASCPCRWARPRRRCPRRRRR